MNPRIAEVTERMEKRRAEINKKLAIEMADIIEKRAEAGVSAEFSWVAPLSVLGAKICQLEVGVEELFRLMGEKEKEAINQEKPNENSPWRK